MLTLTQDCALPSLVAALTEEAQGTARTGFASWPRMKGSLAGEGEVEGVYETKLHRGKTLFLSPEGARAADPLCRAALDEAESAADDRARVVRHLAAAGPSTVEALKSELGLDAGAFRKVREQLERVGAVVSRGITTEDARGVQRHSSVLSRWDQAWRKPWKATEDAALDELILTGVHAAVVTHEDELRTWFTWPVERHMIGALVAAGRLTRPAPGWIALP